MRILEDRVDCSIEDIPLSATESLGFEDLLNARLEQNLELQTAMKKIYSDGGIPDDTIIETYRLNQKYGMYTRWKNNVYDSFPIDGNHWKMRASGRYFTSAELLAQGADADACRPTRSFEIWLYADCSGGTREIMSVKLNEMEFRLLALCGGRATRAEIISEAGLYSSLSSGEFAKEALAAIRRLEELKLVLYSRW
jgi:hypothetical protein